MAETEQTTAAADEPQPQPVEDAAPIETNWRDGLSDELKMNSALLKFNDVENLAKSYVNAQQMIGAEKIPLPNQHASDEEWGEVYSRLGRPDTPSEYELKYDNSDAAEESLAAYSDVAHKFGLNNKQAQGLLEWYSGLETQGNQMADDAATFATQEGMDELKKEWGKAFDQKAGAAQRAAKALLGGTDMFDEITLADGRMLGDHPAIVSYVCRPCRAN